MNHHSKISKPENQFFKVEKVNPEFHKILLELRENKARIQAIVDTAVDGIITMDEKCIVDSFNAAAEKIFGYRAEEVIGKNINLLMPPPIKEKHDGYVATYFQTGVKKIIGVGREAIGLRKDGTTFPVDLAVSEFRVGQERMFAGILRDITERKKAEQLASLGELSAHIAHEIKNPIAGIQNVMDIFLETFDENDERTDLLREVKNQIKKMNNMVMDLLTFARTSTLEKTRYDLRFLVEEVLFSAKNDPIMKGIQVSNECEVPTPAALVDPVMISQVFLNIVLNAASSISEAKQDNGQIEIRIQRQGTNYRLEFKDNGPGIAKDKQKLIFDPFYTTRARGTGLGLAICKKIVELHEGVINVESDLGKGTTFIVLIPSKD